MPNTAVNMKETSKRRVMNGVMTRMKKDDDEGKPEEGGQFTGKIVREMDPIHEGASVKLPEPGFEQVNDGKC